MSNDGKIKLTENQLKVIKDKYLRDAPSVEAWLRNVARNIALADLLHHPNVREEDIFKGVKYLIKDYDVGRGEKSKVFLLHNGLSRKSDREANFNIFMRNLYNLAAQNTEAAKRVKDVEENFYKILSNFESLPNSPTLMNAGRRLQQLSACYVIPIGDSMEEIYDAVKSSAMIFQSGGGVGYDFSSLRPGGDEVKSTKGVASGPLTFMQIFDKSSDVVKQGGARRAASMGILRYDHPDIMGFINMKKKAGVMENFNVSVAIDKRFIDTVKSNSEYDLINPKNKEVAGRLNARDVWNEMIKSAWETGDPGFVVIDRMNESDSNPTPHIGTIVSTNPCGEIPLLPYEPCNLASINLSKFVKEDGSDFDYEKLGRCVFDVVHFLDNIIEVNNYPLPEIEDIAKTNRRIGLGVMGWAESLVKLRIPYNDERAFKKAEELMKFIDDNALSASEQLARRRGVFANWKGSIFDRESRYFRGKEYRPRNCARTTIAPTGTIGIAAGLQGAGIEPFFAVVYTRYNAAGIDALKEGKTPEEKDTFFEVNPLFEEIAKRNNYFGFSKEVLWKRIDENHKSLVGIKEIPESIQKLFLTSHDLEPMDHVKIQAAFQKYVNNSISKTVNLRNEATIKDVEEVYMNAYEMGCKGVTIYRDGSKSQQVLNLDKKSEKKEKGSGDREHEKSDYYEIQTGQGALHVHINYDDMGPTQVFANLSPIGTEISGMTSAIAILLSKYFSLGGDPVRILKHLNSIKGDKPFGFGSKRVDSIPHAISKVLRKHLIKTGKIEGLNEEGQTKLTDNKKVEFKDDDGNILEASENVVYCPKCYSSNVGMVSGCSKPTCFDCGYSECG